MRHLWIVALLAALIGCVWHPEEAPPLQMAAPTLSRSVVFPHQFELSVWLANRGTRPVAGGEFAATIELRNGTAREILGAVTVPFQQGLTGGEARRVTTIFALPTAVVPPTPITLQQLRIHRATFADGGQFENRNGAHAWAELHEGEQR